jgi:hypothetical protein
MLALAIHAFRLFKVGGWAGGRVGGRVGRQVFG